MVISKVTKWTTAICLVLFLHNVGFAQAVNNAQIHGMVLDQSGAAVVGAEITATQKETGQVQITVSGGDGSFVLPGLPVGAYSLQISAKGFTKYTQTGLVFAGRTKCSGQYPAHCWECLLRRCRFRRMRR